MNAIKIASHQWRKSSYSYQNGECVEVACIPHAIAMRDSKHPDAPVLQLERRTFAALARTIR